MIQVQSTHIDAPDLLGMMPSRAWAVDCLNSRGWGLVFAIDGRHQWLIHNFLPTVDRDRSLREILGVGSSFAFKIIGQEDWTGRRISLARALQRATIPAIVDQAGPEGDAVRARIGRQAYDINIGQFCCGGLNFGYFYDSSPIIAYDGEVAPTYSMYDFTQSTVPGCRTPHLWLRGGRSLYDVLGSDFALLGFDPEVNIDDIMEAAAHRAVPFVVVDVDSSEAAALYPCKLLLSRPDRHVAWRGNKSPGNPTALIDRIRGASVTT